MIFACLIGSVGLQVWAWRRLIRRLQGGTIARIRGASSYAAWAFLPVLLFVGGFAVMVGIEEWLQVALIEERAALWAFPVFALSVLGTLAFTIRCAFVARRPDAA
jgi:hypothetical protein